MNMLVLHVVGARPNFMKVAPVYRELRVRSNVRQLLIHTGQHYDVNMSDVFFEQLGIPAPDVNLRVGSASHAQQTAEIMARFEPLVLEHRPDLVLVYGDVNSTVAAALVCSKMLVRVGHVEAGLRSFDRTMPEEVNRLLTDQLSDLLFTPSKDGNENLEREGIDRSKVHLVGNVMIDTLSRMLPAAERRMPFAVRERFALVTLHRPSNVDDLDWLQRMVKVLCQLSNQLQILFPIHPRTRQRLCAAGIKMEGEEGVRFCEPMPYLEFLALEMRASLVITDSGGIQEETTFLRIPCITVRENTERPITVSLGTNTLVGRDLNKLLLTAQSVLSNSKKSGAIPPLWDGHAAERLAAVVSA
jgi:UDP-N-acetylglucosamine 2-epimerase (non-hydrolysing)